MAVNPWVTIDKKYHTWSFQSIVREGLKMALADHLIDGQSTIQAATSFARFVIGWQLAQLEKEDAQRDETQSR